MDEPQPSMSYRDMFRVARNVLADPQLAPRVTELGIIAKKTFAWMLFAEFLLVIQPYPIKWLFDGLQHPDAAHNLYLLCGGMGLLYIIGTRIHSRQAQLRNQSFWLAWDNLWGYSHIRELRLDTAWHVEHSTGEKDSIVAKNIGKVEQLVDEVVFNTIPITLRVFFTIIGVFWLDRILGLLAMCTMIVFAVAIGHTEYVMGPLRKEFRKQMKRLEIYGSEIIKNYRTLKQFGIEEERGAYNWKLLDEFCEHERHRNLVFDRCWRHQEDIVSIARCIMYILIVHAFNPAIGIGSVVLVTAWMERVFSNLYRFDGLQRNLNQGREAAEELCRIFEIVPSIRQQEQPQWPTESQGSFTLQNVGFSFPNRTAETLRGLDLVVHPNECLALIGRTGSGKSTLTSLLIREYDPTAGTISIDGVDLRDIDYRRYRREMIAIVSQKIDLFDGSVLDNIRLGHPSASFDQVIEAARHADAHEFIQKLPKGYESQIGEDGIQLSGGQRQRLAIARALIRKPRVLILDEATSSLDGESQAEVQKAINHMVTSRLATTIIIAHRLSTIRQADRIVVLDEGQIAEIGTHQELYTRNKLYRYFLDRELAGFVDVDTDTDMNAA